MKSITSCLWFNNNVEEATQLYSKVFNNFKTGRKVLYSEDSAHVSGMKKGSLMTLEMQIENQEIIALNGGPLFKFTPATSFFIWRKSEKEVDEMWKKLSQGGQVRMGLDNYPWSKKYGWVADQFGVEWQVMVSDDRNEIAPCLLFVDKLFGKGMEAINLYTSVFKNSKVEVMNQDENKTHIMHALLNLNGNRFVIMDGQGTHGYKFSEAFSHVINCENQKEIDEYWDKLTAQGGAPSQCGWLSDRFGVSWQVAPANMGDMMADPKKSNQIMAAILKMTKIDMNQLEKIYKQ